MRLREKDDAERKPGDPYVVVLPSQVVGTSYAVIVGEPEIGSDLLPHPLIQAYSNAFDYWGAAIQKAFAAAQKLPEPVEVWMSDLEERAGTRGEVIETDPNRWREMSTNMDFPRLRAISLGLDSNQPIIGRSSETVVSTSYDPEGSAAVLGYITDDGVANRYEYKKVGVRETVRISNIKDSATFVTENGELREIILVRDNGLERFAGRVRREV